MTALASNLGDAASGSEACGYFEYLEVMKSQQAQKATKSFQLHRVYYVGGHFQIKLDHPLDGCGLSVDAFPDQSCSN